MHLQQTCRVRLRGPASAGQAGAQGRDMCHRQHHERWPPDRAVGARQNSLMVTGRLTVCPDGALLRQSEGRRHRTCTPQGESGPSAPARWMLPVQRPSLEPQCGRLQTRQQTGKQQHAARLRTSGEAGQKLLGSAASAHPAECPPQPGWWAPQAAVSNCSSTQQVRHSCRHGGAQRLSPEVGRS